MEQLLTTKINVPLARLDLVPRIHLIERLNEGLNRKLTLISAPAGFGKTTLVTSWLQQVRAATADQGQEGFKIAWLSLDESDNDPVRFLNYVVAAINAVNGIEALMAGKLQGMLQSPQPPPTKEFLTTLINQVAVSAEKIVLVLDDYHVLDSSDIDDGITFLLEHLPNQLHVVIISRNDPSLPLPRLRVRDQLVEVRAADLRFSPSEAAEFLNKVMGLDLTDKDVNALENRTEGWIAGLQMAAISMKGNKEPKNLIQSFTGSHHFVLDYLIQEVLEQQPEHIQDFLLQTSVLDRFTASLCDVVTGETGSQKVLEELEHANLFIVPLDRDSHWYRYHHLFADLLRHRLAQSELASISTLRHRASGWYQENGFVDDAIDQALQAKEYHLASAQIEKYINAIWQGGEHRKLTKWLALLPETFIRANSVLCLFQAWFAFVSGQNEIAEEYLLIAEQNVDKTTSTKKREVLGRIATIRTYMASYRADPDGIIRYSKEALGYLRKTDLTWRGIVMAALGDAYVLKGDYPAAHQARLESLEAFKASGNIFVFLNNSMKYALNLRAEGRLPETIEICRQRYQFAQENGLGQTGIAGWILAVWGETLAEQNNLTEGIKLVRQGLELTQRSEDIALISWCNLCLIVILFSMGDYSAAMGIIEQVNQAANERMVPLWIRNLIAGYQIRIWLELDQTDLVSRWMGTIQAEALENSNPMNSIDFILLARTYYKQGDRKTALEILRPLLKKAEAGGHTMRAIKISCLIAIVAQAEGDMELALSTLNRALQWGEPGGFIRSFVDEGPPIENLLKKYKPENDRLKDYSNKLLAVLKSPELQAVSESDQPLIDPLSEREIEVLQLIAKGLTNHQIASRLFLSENTVKVHTRNIYGKLNVNSRLQAVSEARKIGVLPPEDN